MANVGIERTKLDNLAVAISDRTGKPLPMKVDDMIDALGTMRTTTRDKWERPSDWPDLSKMDVSAGNILYMTSYADEARGFCDFYVNCTGNYTVELGHLSGSSFVTESTETYSSGTRCQLYYGSANGTYKVLKVTGTTITRLIVCGQTIALTINNFHAYSTNHGIIDVYGKLPSCTNIGFSNSYNLVNVDIPYLTLSSVISAFAYCYALKSVNTTGWNTSNVTSMSTVFAYCYSLASLDVSNFNTSNVTSMSNMFSNCCSLSPLDVSNFNTSKVTNMTNMFYNCCSLSALDVSGWNTSSATNMSNMFYGCYSLPLVNISNFDFSKCTTASSTGNMFNACYGLHSSLTIPSTATYIGSSCFSGTRSIYEYHFKSTTPPTLNSTNAFNNMTDYGGKKIYVPSASLSAYQTATNWSTYASYMVGE